MATPLTDPPKIIGRELHLDRLIGSGGFGEVYLAVRTKLATNPKHSFTFPAECVVKVMRRGLCTEEDIAAMNREVATLSSMDHPYIVPYIGAWVEAARGKFFGCYCLAMKYCEGGDLHGFIERHIRAHRLPPVDTSVRIMAQVFSALNYSHSRRLIHRDIKPGNVFLTLGKSGMPDKVMLGDYGLVRSLEETRQLVKTRVGTPTYISPEIAAGEAYSTKTDIFSAGTMFYELLSLHRPFWKRMMTDQQLFREVLHRDPMPQFRAYTGSVYGTALANVIEACLTKHEANRATAYDVLVRLTSPITAYVLKYAIPVYPEKDALTASSPPPPAASSAPDVCASAVDADEKCATVRERLERLLLVRKGSGVGARLTRLLSHNAELLFQVRVLVACRSDNTDHLENGLAELLWAFPDAEVPFQEVIDLVMSDYRQLAE
ncbi:protein kinase, putative [Leishmania tarentolae]|uniref:Protein kinase, putative n=1 Tax=Leishmania tarentolae TaxID=5689 RepID=A0A640KJ80_LEITA|nr:protein kinase, putative [Leishmania tarentolae]